MLFRGFDLRPGMCRAFENFNCQRLVTYVNFYIRIVHADISGSNLRKIMSEKGFIVAHA